MGVKTSIDFVAYNLRDVELWPKVTDMLDYIVSNFDTELEDIKYKYRGPDVVREEVIKEIIIELGFEYIKDIMDTISNFEFNVLLDFISLLNLLKGSREGMELVLKLLGFDSVIREWWEKDPQDEPHTYDLTVIMNTTYITDVDATLDKVQVFARNYVYPILKTIDFTFQFDSFLEKNANMAGFVKMKLFGTIRQRAGV